MGANAIAIVIGYLCDVTRHRTEEFEPTPLGDPTHALWQNKGFEGAAWMRAYLHPCRIDCWFHWVLWDARPGIELQLRGGLVAWSEGLDAEIADAMQAEYRCLRQAVDRYEEAHQQPRLSSLGALSSSLTLTPSPKGCLFQQQSTFIVLGNTTEQTRIRQRRKRMARAWCNRKRRLSSGDRHH